MQREVEKRGLAERGKVITAIDAAEHGVGVDIAKVQIERQPAVAAAGEDAEAQVGPHQQIGTDRAALKQVFGLLVGIVGLLKTLAGKTPGPDAATIGLR